MMQLLSPNRRCAQVFRDLARKVTGRAPTCVAEDDGKNDIILIGSDAINPVVHQLIANGKVETLSIATSTDDFRLLSLQDGKRTILILAGGRTRADYYAIYHYFEHFCGCQWFWDGDIIPKRRSLPMKNIDVTWHFRLRYRGLRYFAHRSLHRFQAEHWSLPEWKQELDYLLKRKFNLFMLRIGHDDIFQKAFPDIVDYPPEDRPDPDAIARSYDDRTSFWGLRERGRIRKAITDYAAKLDLIHPVDLGPFTHWYSRTPSAFLEAVKPVLLDQNTHVYHEATGKIWDLADDKNVENYWKLTLADIRHYDRPDAFHIIGLAERTFGKTRRENLQLKLYAYRRFIRLLRESYPNAPLFIPAWDLMIQWKAEEVPILLKELDPENTIILDYTQDVRFENGTNDFMKWGLPHHFPYIFGIFQGVERYSGSAFDFDYTEKTFAVTKNDPFCKGMVLWPEMSHAHSLLHEYLARRSAGEPFSLSAFCRNRYGATWARPMEDIWKKLKDENAQNSFHYTGLVFDDTFNLLDHLAKMPSDHDETAMRAEYRRLQEMRPRLSGVYAALADMAKGAAESPMVIRDVVDLARTHLMSDIVCELGRVMEALWNWRHTGKKKPSADRFVRLTIAMRDLLATQPEYSLLDSLQRLRAVHPVNPCTESTLKGNAENFYCRTYITELAAAIYIPEAEFLRDWIAAASRTDRIQEKAFLDAEAAIREKFYGKSLTDWQTPAQPLADVLLDIESI